MVSYLVPVFINVSSNFFIGNSITEQDVKEMLFSADVDGDGMINYEEFLKVMVGFRQTLDLSPSFSINFFSDSFQGQWSTYVLNLNYTR